jgi:BirA family transcriptional regulator, biotin operon repressor / biotin---[acetyl-CoA-carboxylase] ligase
MDSRTFERWTIYEFAEVSSTNLVAANLGHWSAVRAEVQTAGRGRFERGWVSDAGGLWLSAVLPLGEGASKCRALPLVIGMAVCETIRQLGVNSIRMRWPNDLLVNDCKLAGILVDQFSPGSAVAGVGLNVLNSPEKHDKSLVGQTTRLADLMPRAPAPADLALRVLASLSQVWIELENFGAEKLLPRLNALWEMPRMAQLDLGGRHVAGIFAGVDACGRLQIRGARGALEIYEPHQVRLFREII